MPCLRVGFKGDLSLVFWRDTVPCVRVDTLSFFGGIPWLRVDLKGHPVLFLGGQHVWVGFKGYNPSSRVGLKGNLSVFGRNTIRL